MIYFDSAASYPVLKEAELALIEATVRMYGNPSSTHAAGEQASRIVEATRESIADSIEALPSEIVFTSGATESNNLVLKGHFSLPEYSDKRHIVITSIEHKCVHAITDYLARTCNVKFTVVAPNEEGLITREAVESALTNETSLVSVMHVNNELGTTNPIKSIGELCLSRGIKFHTDAAQSFLKSQIDVDEMCIDYLSLSGHKIGAPKGIGAVYIRDRRSLPLEPIIHGAGQENGLRGGTLPAPIINSFKSAIEAFAGHYEILKNKKLKEYLLSSLANKGINFFVNGEGIPSIISLTLPDIDVSALMRETNTTLSLSTGSACSSTEIEISHVLSALGLDRKMGERTLRLSFHHNLNCEDIDTLITAIGNHSD